MEPTSTSPMELPAKVVEEIRYKFVIGFDNCETIFGDVVRTHAKTLGVDLGLGVDEATEVALRSAIQAAFTEKLDEMKSWPSSTDCDRLLAAFAALDEQGIVALEMPGFTLRECYERAADLSVTRDEVGEKKTIGYCVYTWNDWTRTLEGDDLVLAYGPWGDDQEEWASIGKAVLQTCRAAGLEAEWSGSTDDFVSLRGFRWQRRLALSNETDVRDFLESWDLELRAGYTDLAALAEEFEERAGDFFEKLGDYGPTLRERLWAHTEAFLEAEQGRESEWTDATTNDRITGAFEELRQQGILADECPGHTIQDGWGYAGIAAGTELAWVEQADKNLGVVFFHGEDVIDAIERRELLLAFGVMGGDPSNEEAATIALGTRIVATLGKHGVSCKWSGSTADRIRIEPFTWRRRRWTEAPRYARSEAAAPSPVLAEHPVPLGSSEPIGDPRCGIVVKAVRLERGFDLRRSRRLRACWEACGHKGSAQVGHAGVPHVFVRMGEFTSMMPQRAHANDRQQMKELFLRGVRATRPS